MVGNCVNMFLVRRSKIAAWTFLVLLLCGNIDVLRLLANTAIYFSEGGNNDNIDTYFDGSNPNETERWLQKRKTLLSTSSRPTKLFLSAYMRGGSSIAGELFNLDPTAIMWYEPGDGFFASYHGLMLENLPQNDLYLRNMTRRTIDRAELSAMSDFYSNMLTCDLATLPPEAMSHHFLMKSKALKRYCECLRTLDRKDTTTTRCRKHISDTCGTRYVQLSKDNHCHELLEETRRTSKGYKPKASSLLIEHLDMSSEQLHSFMKHEDCLQRMENQNSKCLGKALNACTKSALRVLQVNRMKIEDLEYLIQRHPDIFVIHYIRDPRAIAVSRSNNVHLLWGKNKMDEVRFLCHRMAEDLRHRRILEERYPGVFLQIKYEDLVHDPVQTAQHMYRFINKSVPSKWAAFATEAMHSRNEGGSFDLQVKDAKVTASKWRKSLNSKHITEIDTFCGELLDELDYNR